MAGVRAGVAAWVRAGASVGEIGVGVRQGMEQEGVVAMKGGVTGERNGLGLDFGVNRC